jgi:hypothetical protein
MQAICEPQIACRLVPSNEREEGEAEKPRVFHQVSDVYVVSCQEASYQSGMWSERKEYPWIVPY